MYPREALRGLRTALVGFCAAFLGRQDCAWIEEAGLTATCVDPDADRLDEMHELYPEQWSFVRDDVYRYAQTLYVFGYQFDLVSLDPPTNQFTRCADNADSGARWPAAWSCSVRGVTPLSAPRTAGRSAPRTTARTSRGGVYWTTLVPA